MLGVFLATIVKIKYNQLPSETSLLVSFAVLLIATLAILVASYGNTRKAYWIEQDIDHTYELISENQEVTSYLADATASARGYAISGENKFLLPYEEAKSTVPAHIERLKNLSQKDPARRQFAQTMDDMTQELFSKLDGVIQARKNGDLEVASTIVMTSGGKPIMDEIRAVTKERKNVELTSLAKGYWHSAIAAEQANHFYLLLGAIVLLLYCALALALYTRIRERRRDFTELESLNAELRGARDKAIEASMLKSQFVRNISHEMRTPVSGLLASAELLSDRNLDLESHQLVGYIFASAKNLLKVINEILDFSKLEAMRLKLDEMPFMMADVVDAVTAAVSPEATRKGITIESNIARDVPTQLIGDPLRLEQALLNLASNAIKFTHKGTVKIGVHAAERQENNRIVILFSVIDTGIGVPSGARNKLFEPFVQADGTDTRQYGGTGLGLAISRSLVELMSGQIGMNSKEGQGSMFWFKVPLQLLGARSEDADAPPAVPQRQKN
jgi:signal transduction histidine kinase